MLDKFNHYFAVWRQRQTARNELYALSDLDLEDIGINRADIPTIVQKGLRY